MTSIPPIHPPQHTHTFHCCDAEEAVHDHQPTRSPPHVPDDALAAPPLHLPPPPPPSPTLQDMPHGGALAVFMPTLRSPPAQKTSRQARSQEARREQSLTEFYSSTAELLPRDGRTLGLGNVCPGVRTSALPRSVKNFGRYCS